MLFIYISPPSFALGDHVFEHGYFKIKKILNLNSNDIEFVVLLFANAATVTGKLIDEDFGS